MTPKIKRILFSFLLAAAALLLDRVSKMWITRTIPLYGEITPIPALKSYFSFFHSTNSGVAFGLFQGGTWFFTLIAMVAVVAIAYYIVQNQENSLLIATSLGLMLGGAAGNLWDRLMYGSVIDFILVRASETLIWPTFNLADSAIVVGTGVLILYFLREERQHS